MPDADGGDASSEDASVEPGDAGGGEPADGGSVEPADGG